ncbi:unnamed protein product [Taenia asiatica]|uniref:DnaJ homolog subfamily C member 1 n=1 Tax=Taenia asiatica TaxID=60517 RepID=A0A0R3VSG0_TAEAS|nr:unnamed protein product [Taenia asiatica]
MFDLMEEMNKNFYDFLDVPTAASSVEIKRAYRKLSLEMHPDRNPNDPDAGVKFRQLSVVYQILKDKERRLRYDEALETGIPDWRTPVFYYRKLRKMSNVEIAALVSAVAITIHFATLWGLAIDKRWTLREQLESHMKRHKASDRKKTIIDSEIAEQLKAIKWPSFMDILPIALVRGIFGFILGIPARFGSLASILCVALEKVQEGWEEQRELRREQEKRIQRREKQKKRQAERSKLQHQQNKGVDFDDINPSMYQVTNLVAETEELLESTNSGDEVKDTVSKPWSQTEEIALIRLTNKYPGGYPSRWSKIAQILGRTVNDVTAKATGIASGLSSRALLNPVLDDFSKDLSENEGENMEENEEDDYYLSGRKARRVGKTVLKEPKKEEVAVPDAEEKDQESDTYVSRKKQKAFSKNKPVVMMVSQEASGQWTQKEQNQLETAMSSFPKETPHRWQLVAECVPSRTLAEVINRVKFLAENTKKKAAVS